MTRPAGHTTRARTGAFALLAVVGCIAAACQGGDDAASPTTTTTEQETLTSPTSEPATSTSPPTPATTTTPPTPPPTAPPTTTVPATPVLGPLTWADCDGGFECATLAVPLDHRLPSGAMINIPVIRQPARGPGARIGSVVTNPGGPGGSGVGFLRNAIGAFTDLNERFDVVSFDPRGVADASPAVRCHDDFDDQVLVAGPGGLSEAALTATVTADKARCAAVDPAFTSQVGTNNAARDLDWLRSALGDTKLTFLGFSYGTRLGAAYAELYPDGARAIALDGGDIPTQALNRTVADQYQAFERAFVSFIAWCDGQSADGCGAQTAGGAAAAFRAAEASLQAATTLPTRLGSRRLTLGEFYLGVVTALYSQGSWRSLGNALRQAAVDGDGTALQQLADSLLDRRRDGSYTNAADANIAVNCADDPERPTIDDALARGKALGATMPFLGPLAIAAFTDCVSWPVAIDPVAVPTGKVTIPVVVVGTTGDPATPFEWSVQLAQALGNAYLIRNSGEGHTGYFSFPCVRDAVNAYLFDGTKPPPEC